MRDSFWRVSVQVFEAGRWVGAGDYCGLAATIDEAVARAVKVASRIQAKGAALRASSAACLGPVQFGRAK
jgi:hypothetical protein